MPVGALRLAFSAAVRQGPDGRLSQVIGDSLDMAALDGASAGPYTLLGALSLLCIPAINAADMLQVP